MTLDRADGPASRVLLASVARRHYLAGRSKVEIGQEFGLSRFQVARLLDKAVASGLVRIEIGGPGPVDLDASSRLQEAFGLRHAVVVGVSAESGAPLRAQVGAAAAELLTEIVMPRDVLGLAWARAVSAAAHAVTDLACVPVVQLTGSLPVGSHRRADGHQADGQPGASHGADGHGHDRRGDVSGDGHGDDGYDDSGVELVRALSRVSGGPAYFFYAPMMLPDAGTARALRAQPEVARAFDRFRTVTKAVTGIGLWGPRESTVHDAASLADRARLTRLGVVAECCGVFLAADGTPVANPLTERMVGISADQLRAVPEVIGVPYGAEKAPAVRAALRSGLVSSLVTHASLASALLDGG